MTSYTWIPRNPQYACQMRQIAPVYTKYDMNAIELVTANFLLLTELEKIIKKPPDHTGNEPTLNIPLGGSQQEIKVQHDKYMPCELNMLIMHHVNHLRMDMESKKPTKIPTCTPIDTNPIYSIK